MSNLRFIEPRTVLSAGVMTGTDVLRTSALDVGSISNAAFSAVWTGTAVGSFKVEVSVDGTNYSDLGVSISDAAGSADYRVINVAGLGVKYVRLVYTNASGTGSLTVTAMAKGA